MKQLLLSQKQLFLFVLAGAMSAVLEIGSFKWLSITLPEITDWEYDWYGIHYPLSNVLSTGMGILSNYFFSIWFVFSRGKHSKRKEFVYFMAISVISTLLSLVFFQFFYGTVFRDEYFDLGFFVFSSEMLSKISAIVLVAALNYTVKKKLIFNG
ncbi:GtrA family protein [Bergeyella sp. RCAD1439]|uniref:GtrA family protein n=1 Tax=Bergeyella anatis TaxID=3113737 RepID=UPI002E1927CC|nr:GtrA family protein [Bergeyella sp. RCAD1439]